eukprot:m.471622 g.471622  ORF g.471622 m.471622 type:complete len:332 (+) comp31330_c0_seq1:127-1122(+)
MSSGAGRRKKGGSTLRFKKRGSSTAPQKQHSTGKQPPAGPPLTVIRIDDGTYLVQAVPGEQADVAQLDQWVQVEFHGGRCSGSDPGCAESTYRSGGGGECAHVRAAAAAVYSGSTVKRLGWREQLERLRARRAAATRDHVEPSEVPHGAADYFPQRPTPLEEKMGRWKAAKDAYDFEIGDTESESDASAGDRTPPHRGATPPPFWPPPGGYRSQDVGSEGSAAAAPPPQNDGAELFNNFVLRWKAFVSDPTVSSSFSRVPFPTDHELENMLPSTLPERRRRGRHRQLLLLLHPDKATSKVTARLPTRENEAVACRLKEIAQKLTELGQSLH